MQLEENNTPKGSVLQAVSSHKNNNITSGDNENPFPQAAQDLCDRSARQTLGGFNIPDKLTYMHNEALGQHLSHNSVDEQE